VVSSFFPVENCAMTPYRKTIPFGTLLGTSRSPGESQLLLLINALPESSQVHSGCIVGKSEVIRLLSHLPVTQEKSRNNPGLLCNLAFGVWNLRLPQFDRISLRVMHAGEPTVGIRLRVNLYRDSGSL
jgi:hypothetical protein